MITKIGYICETFNRGRTEISIGKKNRQKYDSFG